MIDTNNYIIQVNNRFAKYPYASDHIFPVGGKAERSLPEKGGLINESDLNSTSQN
ncbi:MAG: hypothetical protein RIF33_14065 [Cyclobacteriaceae bacterium]